jgi:heptosyltransferase II
VNWLGDAVMTTPALQRLREALPDSHLTLLTPEKLTDLWQHHPSLDALITLSAGESLWSVAGRLRAGAFQTALVLPNWPRSALEAWLARIPQRIGYARPWRSWLLTQPLAMRPGHVRMPKRSVSEVNDLVRCAAGGSPPAARPSPPRTSHQIHDYLFLVTALGASAEPVSPRLEISAAEVRQADATFLSDWRNRMQKSALATAPVLLGLNPGAEYGPAKRWPPENFAAVARAVSRQIGDCLWLAFGGSGDWQVCQDVARLAGGGVLNLAGKTSLRQLMALLKLCRVVLTNDSGPMHVAAALGTRVVVPFGSTSPELTGPGLPGDPRHRLLKSDAPCAPCFRRVCPIDFRCMAGISTDRVTEAVLQILSPQNLRQGE